MLLNVVPTVWIFYPTEANGPNAWLELVRLSGIHAGEVAKLIEWNKIRHSNDRFQTDCGILRLFYVNCGDSLYAALYATEAERPNTGTILISFEAEVVPDVALRKAAQRFANLRAAQGVSYL